MSHKTLAAEPYALDFDPAATALILIDMQRDFLEPGGFGELLGNDVSRLRGAIPPCARLLAAALSPPWCGVSPPGRPCWAPCWAAPFANAVYIGHPGWKEMGGRVGYSLATGALVLTVTWLGITSLLLDLIPGESGLGVTPPVTLGYLLMAGFLCLCPRLVPGPAREPAALAADDALLAAPGRAD